MLQLINSRKLKNLGLYLATECFHQWHILPNPPETHSAENVEVRLVHLNMFIGDDIRHFIALEIINLNLCSCWSVYNLQLTNSDSCTKGICSWMWIRTLDWQSVESWLIFVDVPSCADWFLWVGQLSNGCWSICWLSVHRVLAEYLLIKTSIEGRLNASSADDFIVHTIPNSLAQS